MLMFYSIYFQIIISEIIDCSQYLPLGANNSVSFMTHPTMPITSPPMLTSVDLSIMESSTGYALKSMLQQMTGKVLLTSVTKLVSP